MAVVLPREDGSRVYPVVRYKKPRSAFDADKAIQQFVTANGYVLGTRFEVQFISDDETQILECGEFVITSFRHDLTTNESNPYQPQTKSILSVRAEQVGQWWTPPSMRKPKAA